MQHEALYGVETIIVFCVELHTQEELQEMLDNTMGFFHYCKLKKQLEQDEDRYGAFKWLFNPDFIPLPIDPEEAKKISKSDVWWIEKTIMDHFKREWNTPLEFRVTHKTRIASDTEG